MSVWLTTSNVSLAVVGCAQHEARATPPHARTHRPHARTRCMQKVVKVAVCTMVCVTARRPRLFRDDYLRNRCSALQLRSSNANRKENTKTTEERRQALRYARRRASTVTRLESPHQWRLRAVQLRRSEGPRPCNKGIMPPPLHR